jgi:hypothetical protein
VELEFGNPVGGTAGDERGAAGAVLDVGVQLVEAGAPILADHVGKEMVEPLLIACDRAALRYRGHLGCFSTFIVFFGSFSKSASCHPLGPTNLGCNIGRQRVQW